MFPIFKHGKGGRFSEHNLPPLPHSLALESQCVTWLTLVAYGPNHDLHIFFSQYSIINILNKFAIFMKLWNLKKKFQSFSKMRIGNNPVWHMSPIRIIMCMTPGDAFTWIPRKWWSQELQSTLVLNSSSSLNHSFMSLRQPMFKDFIYQKLCTDNHCYS